MDSNDSGRIEALAVRLTTVEERLDALTPHRFTDTEIAAIVNAAPADPDAAYLTSAKALWLKQHPDLAALRSRLQIVTAEAHSVGHLYRDPTEMLRQLAAWRRDETAARAALAGAEERLSAAFDVAVDLMGGWPPADGCGTVTL
jgi:hypothetical protein